MRISLQPAYVLHHRPYRETSLLIDFLTQDYGRISVNARGVRGKRSKLQALLQPFMPLLISFQGRSDLMTFIGAENNGAAIRLHGKCLLGGLYLNELLIRILQKQDSHTQLYTIYQQTLLELHGTELQQKCLRLFEKHLLTELGYGLQWDCDFVTGERVSPQYNYEFCKEQGFKRIFDPNIVENPLFVFSGKSILSLAKHQLDDEQSLRDAKRLMRLVLTPLIGTKPLQSRKLFKVFETVTD